MKKPVKFIVIAFSLAAIATVITLAVYYARTEPKSVVTEHATQLFQLIDDFEAPSPFPGEYRAIGENNLGNEATAISQGIAYSGTHSRVLHQTLNGSQPWGILLERRFATPLDISRYDALTFQLFCQELDAERTLGIELVMSDDVIYSLKPEHEIDLSAAFNTWYSATVPLASEQWMPATRGAPRMFDPTQVSAIYYILRNHNSARKIHLVYFDDIHLKADLVSPDNLWIANHPDCVTLQWDKVKCANQYNIYRTTNNSLPEANDLIYTSGGEVDEYTDTQLTDGVAYYYWVTSTVNRQESHFSSPVIGGVAIDRNDHMTLKTINHNRAKRLIEKLFNHETGAQASYNGMRNTDELDNSLVKYGRTWCYDAGISLNNAVYENDGTAKLRAQWFKDNAVYIDHPDEDRKLFGGWPFSKNQVTYGDGWTDPRLVTGANAWTLHGFAAYAASDLSTTADKQFFAEALEGILYHIVTEGPNTGLVTAGWSVAALQDPAKFGKNYNHLISDLGDAVQAKNLALTSFKQDDLKPVRMSHTVTEHCIDVLDLLNYTLDNYVKLFDTHSLYSYNQLRLMRDNLRAAIFEKLFHEQEQRFITGRTAEGIRSEHTAIDNTTWLSSALKLDDLSPKQVENLSSSLLYTTENFVKTFEVNEIKYLGAHYFLSSFNDKYIDAKNAQENALHIEATAGLILGLQDFADAWPQDPNTPYFRKIALQLWLDMQYYVKNNGFAYSSLSIQDLFSMKEVTVSAVWYLQTHRYFTKNLKLYTQIDRLHQPG